MSLVGTLPLLAYNFNAITHTGDYAHIQVLTKKNHSTISKISLEKAVYEKNIKNIRYFKQSYSICQIFYWICSIAVFVIFQNIILHYAQQILDWNKSNSKFDKYYRTVLSNLRLNVFLKNCLSKEICEMVESFFLLRT